MLLTYHFYVVIKIKKLFELLSLKHVYKRFTFVFPLLFLSLISNKSRCLKYGHKSNSTSCLFFREAPLDYYILFKNGLLVTSTLLL